MTKSDKFILIFSALILCYIYRITVGMYRPADETYFCECPSEYFSDMVQQSDCQMDIKPESVVDGENRNYFDCKILEGDSVWVLSGYYLSDLERTTVVLSDFRLNAGVMYGAVYGHNIPYSVSQKVMSVFETEVLDKTRCKWRRDWQTHIICYRLPIEEPIFYMLDNL